MSFALAKGLTWLILQALALLPRKGCLAIGRGLGRLAFKLIKDRAQVAIDNLKLVYGDQMTPEQRVDLARANFAHLGGALVELLRTGGRPSSLNRFVTVEGEEHLQKARARGKGVVIFSAHMGNFILFAAVLARFGQFKILFRDPTQPLVSKLYLWLLARLQIQVIPDNPRPACAHQSYGHLRKGGLLGVLIDQVENGGIYVDFMGHPAGSTVGAAGLALRSGAPLIPAVIVRQPDGRLKLTIEPEFKIERQGEYGQLQKPAVAAMNQVVEKWVRAHPDQWFWGHRRWRQWRK